MEKLCVDVEKMYMIPPFFVLENAPVKNMNIADSELPRPDIDVMNRKNDHNREMIDITATECSAMIFASDMRIPNARRTALRRSSSGRGRTAAGTGRGPARNLVCAAAAGSADCGSGRGSGGSGSV